MKKHSVITITFLSVIMGILSYALYKRIIIIQLPSLSNEQTVVGHTTKKNSTVYYWYQGSWKHEITTIIATENKSDTISYVVTNWLNVLEQATAFVKNIRLEQVMFSPSGSDLYLSFDKTLFAKEETTFEKWMRIEGLLKTVQAAQLGISRVYVLVHHKPLFDDHLDFSCPWPIQGFLE